MGDASSSFRHLNIRDDKIHDSWILKKIKQAVYEVEVDIPNNTDLTNNYKDMKNTVKQLQPPPNTDNI